VIEIGSPAIHATHTDHEMTLPPHRRRARDFDGSASSGITPLAPARSESQPRAAACQRSHRDKRSRVR